MNNGLEVILDSEAYDYGHSLTGDEGFSISVNHNLDIPIMRHSALNVIPGQALHIGVKPTFINTTMGAKRRFTPTERMCYFNEEISLAHFIPGLSFRWAFECRTK